MSRLLLNIIILLSLSSKLLDNSSNSLNFIIKVLIFFFPFLIENSLSLALSNQCRSLSIFFKKGYNILLVLILVFLIISYSQQCQASSYSFQPTKRVFISYLIALKVFLIIYYLRGQLLIEYQKLLSITIKGVRIRLLIAVQALLCL